MTQLLPPKKEVALALLERSNVDVYLDPRAKGVVVPPQFRKEPRLILKIGLNMPVPIPDLRLDDESMSCTLSFNRTKFYCVVPWLSVFAMVGDDGRGMVWPDDVPQELAQRPAAVAAVPPPRESEEGPPTSSRGKGGKARLQAADRPSESGESRRSGRAADPDAPRSKRPGKKKKDEPTTPSRPLLVAVPTREKPRVEKLDDHRPASASGASTEGGGETEERPTPPPAPRVPTTTSSSRPKRELPPYLRVVK